jgi:chromosome segregation ATPase
MSLIAVLSSVIIATWIKLMTGRAFTSIDKKIKDLEDQIKETESISAKLDNFDRGTEKDLVRIQEALKALDSATEKLSQIDSLRVEFLEKFQRKSEFVREIQIINNQIDAILKKMDHVDAKLDHIQERLPAKRGTND